MKLKLLLLRLLRNVKILNSVANTNIIMLLEAGITVGHSQIRTRQMWKFDRKSTFWECDVPLMDDKRFKENFRLNKEAFQKVCEKLRSMERIDTNMRRCIPFPKRVAIALYALGSAAEYRTVANLFGVGRSTVGEIVMQFCHAVCDNFAAECISSYPPHPQEMKRIIDGFAHLGFPQCFGAVDVCHIEMLPKKEDAVDYCNYEGWYSVVLLASCDHSSKFTYINIGSKGQNDDSDIFEESSLKKFHENAEVFLKNSTLISGINVPVLLIGDSAFPLSSYLMKPYPYSQNQSEIERTFNYRLFKSHRVIENTFSQLKARFQRIDRGLQVSPKNVNVIIKTCCILHNFLKVEMDEIPSAWMENTAEGLNTRCQPRHTTRVGENDITATALRNAIALSFLQFLEENEGATSIVGVEDDESITAESDGEEDSGRDGGESDSAS